MAGGTSALAPPERVKRGKFSKRKRKKRIGFSLDMTPLVDITFLLLTFFMFTTTMAAPQVMEMSIPPEMNVEIKVNQNELLTIRVRDDGKIFWNMATDDPQPVQLKDIQKIAENENLRPEVQNKLITVLKVSENASYGELVSILDELNLAEVKITNVISQKKDANGNPEKRQRRFTLAPLDSLDINAIKGL